MKIVNLKAENIKKLVAVEIAPSGEIVTIAGRNGQGKTSVLDSIWWALAGADNIQAQPIRAGQNKARIRLDLGEIVVERKFTAAGSTLSVTNAEGARYSSPQKMLDALLGELSFDPLSFSRMPARKQFDELRRVARVDLDLDALEADNKRDFDLRTEVNRDAKARRAQVDGIVIPTVSADGPVDEQALLAQMEAAAATNGEIETKRSRRAAAAQQVEANRRTAAEDEASAAEKRRQADALIEAAERLEEKRAALMAETDALAQRLAEAPPLGQPVDVSALRQQIDAARAQNAALTARAHALKQREVVEADADELEKRAAALTAAIADRNAKKDTAIQAASMPVAGLGFGAGQVTFNGTPLDQCSSAEQLRISLAIAMAANPKVRVIRIQDGSLLDDDSLRAVADMAKAGDYQVWIEKVDTSGSVGIVIEDGHVKTINPEAAELTAA